MGRGGAFSNVSHSVY